MNVLFRLLQKEWRDHQALVVAGALLAPIFSRVIQWAFVDRVEEEMTGRWILPGLVAFLLAAVAAELVGRESESGVGDTLGRLPVRAGTLLAAKLLFLVCVALAVVAWVLGVELAWRAADGRPVAALVEQTLAATTVYACVGFGTLLGFALGVLLRRGFAAAAGGLVIAGGLPFLLQRLDGTRYGWWITGVAESWPVAAVSCVLLAPVAGAFLAYRPAAGSARDALRRAALFACGFFGVLAVAGSAAEVARHFTLRLPFYDETVRIERVAPSPDGRSIALSVERGAFNVEGFQQGLWMLDVETAELGFVAAGRGRLFGGWSAPGEAWVYDGYSAYAAREIDGSWELEEEIELEALSSMVSWLRRLPQEGKHDFVVEWRNRGLSCEVAGALSFTSFCYGETPGTFFYLTVDGRLLGHSLEENSTWTVLDDLPHEKGRVYAFASPDARRLAVILHEQRGANREFTPSSLSYHDARTGERLAGPLLGSGHVAWTGWDAPWAIARHIPHVYRHGQAHTFQGIGGGDVEFELASYTRLHPFAGERWLLQRGNRLELLALDGTLLRVLYEPREL